MKRIVVVVVYLLLIGAIVAAPVMVVRAQTPEPENALSIPSQEEILAIAVQATVLPGACQNLPAATFVGSLRNMTLNEDTTAVYVYYDPINRVVCGKTWGTWPGTPDGLGEWYFRSTVQLYERNTDGSLTVVGDPVTLPTVHQTTNPTTVPQHSFSFPIGCGTKTFYLAAVFSQQQKLGGVLLGMDHRDYSGTFRQETCKLYLPLVSAQLPPPPPPSCPTNWKLRVVSPNDGDDLIPYTQSGETVPITYQLTPGQVISFYIEKNGVLTPLVNGETTLTGPDKTVEYGTNPYIRLVGGVDLGYYTYTLESSFMVEGIRCWNFVKIYDPPTLLAQQLIELDPSLSWDEAYDLAKATFESQYATGLTIDEAYQASLIKLNLINK